MRSVADQLRAELTEQIGRMTPAERVALTARLAADDVRLLAAARHISEHEARRIFMRQRQAGRRPSVVMQNLMDQ